MILVGTCHFDPHKYQNYPLKKKKERKKERKKKEKEKKKKKKKKFEPTFILAQILKILPTFPEKKSYSYANRSDFGAKISGSGGCEKIVKSAILR